MFMYPKVLEITDLATFRISIFFLLLLSGGRYSWRSLCGMFSEPLWILLHTYCWVPVCSYQSLCTTTGHINHPYTTALTVCHKQAPERFFQCKTDARGLRKGSLVWVTVVAILFCTTASKTKACSLHLGTGDNSRVC